MPNGRISLPRNGTIGEKRSNYNSIPPNLQKTSIFDTIGETIKMKSNDETEMFGLSTEDSTEFEFVHQVNLFSKLIRAVDVEK